MLEIEDSEESSDGEWLPDQDNRRPYKHWKRQVVDPKEEESEKGEVEEEEDDVPYKRKKY